jgi:hypothetical protein
MKIFLRTGSLAAGLAISALIFVASAAGDDAHHGTSAITCTNLSSRASWQITIDYDQGTVDSHPASISSAEIKWHTPDGENYTLDRKSGNLTVVLASATGGNFLYDRCKMED